MSDAVTWSEKRLAHACPWLSFQTTHPFIELETVFDRKPTVRRLLEVHIGVSKGASCDHVSANPNREDSSGRAEFLVQHGLGHILMQVPDVQGGHRITGSTGVHFRWL